MSDLHTIDLTTLDGQPTSLGDHAGTAMLVVNVASKSGLTPQYEGLERVHERYADRGFTVVGFPCNQFRGQEPGTADEIQEFCSTTYGVTFPLFEKTEKAFLQADRSLARKVIDTTGGLRQTCDLLIQQLLSAGDDLAPDEAVAYVLLARFYKRVTAHLANIASGVVSPIPMLDYLDE